MSHGIAQPVASARIAAAFAHRSVLRALLLTLFLLFSQGVLAEPAAADRALRAAKQDYAMFKYYYSIGKQQAQIGQIDLARTWFSQAQMSAIRTSIDLRQLNQENVDTFQRGLYRDGPSQERAIQQTRIASTTSQIIEAYVQFLVGQPSSQPHWQAVEAQQIQFDHTMIMLEQNMAAAQR